MSTILGVDYAWSKPDPAALKRDGVKFAMRYLSHDASKNLTAAELARLKANGIAVGLVWESTANRALSGGVGGAADAKVAKAQAAALGLAKLPIFFAVDFDATDAQKPTIRKYLEGAGTVLGKSRVGVYGGYHVIKDCYDHGACKWFWQTYAWSGGGVHSANHLYQYKNGITAHGGQYDMNRASGLSFTSAVPVRKKPSLRTRLQWKSNIKVLRRILKNHPEWPGSTRSGLRWALDRYEKADKRGTL